MDLSSAWLLLSAALVLFMTPGLAFFYGGLVKAKSVVSMMMLSFGAMGLVAVLWVLYGFNMSFVDGSKGDWIDQGNCENDERETPEVHGSACLLVLWGTDLSDGRALWPSIPLSYFIAEPNHPALVSLDLRQMQGNIAIDAIEELDAVTNQYRKYRVAHFVGQSKAQALTGDGAATDDPDTTKLPS
jgi:hypothetical protein